MTATSSLPPAPRFHPLVQLVRFLRDPLPLFDQCQRDLGDIFTLRLGRKPWVFLAAPELVKALYTAEPDTFLAGAAKAGLFAPIVGHTSSLVLDGEAHLRRRRLLLPAFHGERVQAYTDVIRRVTEETVARWPQGRPFSAHPYLQSLALNAIVEGIFGAGMDRRVPEVMSRLVTGALGSRLLFTKPLQVDLGRFSPWGRVVRLVREADAAIYAEIARQRRAAPGDDLLSLLLAARDETEKPLSDVELRDELMTLVVAGHEITGLTLAWALASILSAPGAAGRIRDEVAASGEAPGRAPLPYLEAAIKESMRLHSAVANGSVRLVNRPFTVGGYTLPPGITVSVCMHLLHRRPDRFPDPAAFRPERFLDGKVSPYEWAPFGGGSRRCLGMSFALHELKVVLATLLSRSRLALAQPSVRARRRGAFMAPEGGPLIVAHPIS